MAGGWVAAGSVGAAIIGGVLQGDAAKSAANTQAQAQLNAAKIAAEAARFKPVGVTGNATDYYGNTTWGGADGTTPTTNLSDTALAQRNQLAGYAQRGLDQYGSAFDQSQQLGKAGQGMMSLGQSYLQQDPQAQAAQYMSQQQALLAPGREQALAALHNQQQQTGRAGLALGATSAEAGGMMATNPEMAALYNANHMQDLQLAAQSQQGGMQNAQFGQGMITAGAGAYDQMYNMQNKAFSPYQTAQGGVDQINQLGQGQMVTGMNIGGRQSQAGAVQGQILQAGGNAAANSMFNANAYSPWGNALSGAGQALGQYAQSSSQPQWHADKPFVYDSNGVKATLTGGTTFDGN
jgi:hypothetical protein